MSTPGSSGLVSPTVAPYPPSTDHISDDLRSAKSCLGRDRSLVILLLQKQRPDDPRHFVRERDGYQHARFASQHLLKPRSFWRAAFARLLHDGAAADDEEAPQRAFTHFGCPAKLLLASCRSLKRRETQPGGKVAALGESLGRRC